MKAEPSIHCQWCASLDKEGHGTDGMTGLQGWINNLDFSRLEYRHYATMAVVAGSIYGLGIPIVFFLVAHNAKDRRLTNNFEKKYGFLTSKMREQYYYWECMIILRKLLLSLITRYSADNAIRQTLCNLGVLLMAVSIHIYAAPFIHSDANLAELGTLFATLIVLLVGLGSEQVQAPVIS
eukprot:SAG31_NODE_3735_length_3938_cov_1.264913_3_plen_180_part_00